MATLDIRKKSLKTWLHVPSDADNFILSKFYCKTDAGTFKIVEESGSNRREYSYTDITVYDDTDIGTPETFASSQALMLRLEALKYTGFNRDGDIPTSYIESVVAGTNITIDNTDPLNPIISSSGGGSTGGGGASVNYYINGGTSQGTIGGNAYLEMSKTAVIGTGVDFTIATNGYIANFITDVADPSLLKIPGGNWNLEYYFSSSSAGGSPSFYTELYKYDGTTFTLIASNSVVPKGITNGTAIEPYFSSLAVPETVLALTDRLAIRIYVNNSSKTITLHTQDSHLGQLITTFTTGLVALNGLTEQVQSFATGTSGTDFAISSATDTHTFNLPTASATNRGALNSTDWSTFNAKADIAPRLQTVTSSATVTPTSANDLVVITAQADGLTIANPTGTMTEGQALMIRIKDNGTARSIAFGTNYRALGITFPTTTVISKTLYLGCIWNATDTKFDIVGLNQEA
jgi:hypothetical protein